MHENSRMPVAGVAKKYASKSCASHTQRSSDLEPLLILTAAYAHQLERRRKQKLLLLLLLLEEEEQEAEED
jgi:hypothetical protein